MHIISSDNEKTFFPEKWKKIVFLEKKSDKTPFFLYFFHILLIILVI